MPSAASRSPWLQKRGGPSVTTVHPQDPGYMHGLAVGSTPGWYKADLTHEQGTPI